LLVLTELAADDIGNEFAWWRDGGLIASRSPATYRRGFINAALDGL